LGGFEETLVIYFTTLGCGFLLRFESLLGSNTKVILVIAIIRRCGKTAFDMTKERKHRACKHKSSDQNLKESKRDEQLS
jgi:hypothetical protein